MQNLGFYDKYISLMGDLKNKPDLATPYKIKHLKEIINNGKVYKFISFEKDADIKINTIKEDKIWFSFYKTLNDNTEYQIYYDANKIAKVTGYNKAYIDLVVNYLTEMYDVFSLTYMYKEYMWSDYAGNGNGICIEFDIEDYDYLFPIEYYDKSKINYTNMIIQALQDGSGALSTIPWVIKDPYNKKMNMDSTKEKEVRILYCPYDLAEFNNGMVQYNIKEKLHYKGISRIYSDFGLRISKIIIGNKCSTKHIAELENHFQDHNISYNFRKQN